MLEGNIYYRLEKYSDARKAYKSVLKFSNNLDENLEKVARGQIPTHNLHAGSNADLGLMRALELVRALRFIQQQGTRLKV